MSEVSLAVGLGLICALLSALGTNLAFLFKHRGAVGESGVTCAVRPRAAIPR